EDVSGGCGHGRQRSEDRKQRTETEDGGQRTKRLLLIQNKKRFWISNHCPQHSPNLGAETNCTRMFFLADVTMAQRRFAHASRRFKQIDRDDRLSWLVSA